MSIPSFQRLIRFIPRSDASKILIGEPNSQTIDVGIALRQGARVEAITWSGSSVLSPGSRTNRIETVDRVLAPLASHEVGTIRCIGLNYVQHAKEVKVDIPSIPTVFYKPHTSLADPWPAPTILPRITQADNTGDYEAELAVVIGKPCKDVSEADALDYVLGYTACNDVSSRGSQFAQSQWCFSKSFDGSCPIGPTLVSKSLIPDPSKLHIRGLKNGNVMQDCGTSDFIFGVAKVVSFLSQGTTLPAGTVIITGTPAGVGAGHNPKVTINAEDEFRVQIFPHIGTLVNVFKNERAHI